MACSDAIMTGVYNHYSMFYRIRREAVKVANTTGRFVTSFYQKLKGTGAVGCVPDTQLHLNITTLKRNVLFSFAIIEHSETS